MLPAIHADQMQPACALGEVECLRGHHLPACGMAKDRQLYDTLGIAPSATSAEVSSAYRRLALVHHPDKKAPSSSSADGNDDSFSTIRYAHEILSNPSTRRLYDRYGQFGLTLLQHTGGNAEMATRLLDPVRAVLVLLVIFGLVLFLSMTPVMAQCKLDGWIGWQWRTVVAPALLQTGTGFLATLITCIPSLLSISSRDSNVEEPQEQQPVSVPLAIAHAMLPFMASTAAFAAVLLLFVMPEAASSAWALLLLLPWLIFEVSYLAFKICRLLVAPSRAASLFKLFRWSIARLLFLGLLAWYSSASTPTTAPYIANLLVLPLYSGIAFLVVDHFVTRPASHLPLLPLLYPLVTVVLLHIRLTTSAIRWLAVFMPSYTLITILLLACLAGIPCMYAWHRSLLLQTITKSDAEDGRGRKQEAELLMSAFGYAMAPYQLRILSSAATRRQQ